MTWWNTSGWSGSPSYYVDAAHGNDANNGLTYATAKKTLTAAYTQLQAGATGSTLAVFPGTYTNAPWNWAGTGIRNIGFVGDVTIDMLDDATNTSAFSPTSGTTNIYGPPPQFTGLVENCLNNGFGPGGTAVMNIYDVDVDDCDDCISAHNSSALRYYRGTCSNGAKSAFSHIDSTQTYHEDATFIGVNGAANGVGVNINTAYSQFVGCTFIPPAGSSCHMPTFTSTGGTVLTRCKVGTATMTGTWSASVLAWDYVTATDTYLNGFALSRGWNSTFTRCYGTVTVRLRGNASDGAFVAENCVFKAGVTSNRFLNGDFRSAPTEIAGNGTVKNCIFIDHTTAIFAAATNVTDMSANWSFQNNSFFNNTTNMTAGLTADGTDITSNPLLVDTTTDDQAGWKYSALSPCIGAGTGGGNIGIGT